MKPRRELSKRHVLVVLGTYELYLRVVSLQVSAVLESQDKGSSFRYTEMWCTYPSETSQLLIVSLQTASGHRSGVETRSATGALPAGPGGLGLRHGS